MVKDMGDKGKEEVLGGARKAWSEGCAERSRERRELEESGQEGEKRYMCERHKCQNIPMVAEHKSFV